MPHGNRKKGSRLASILTFCLQYVPLVLIGIGSVVFAAEVEAKSYRKALAASDASDTNAFLLGWLGVFSG